jgi:hypothetical protein
MREIAVIGACLIGTSVLLAAPIASAAYVDFEDTGASAAGQTSWVAPTATTDGVTVTVSSAPSGTAISYEVGDGFGVTEDCGSTRKCAGYEWDEIEKKEQLTVQFDSAVVLSSISLTDLFNENGYLETGTIDLYSGDGTLLKSVAVIADEGQFLNSSNGLLDVVTDVQGLTVTKIVFTAPGKAYEDGLQTNKEFSVAKIAFEKATGVPELDPRSAAGGISLAACGLLIALGRRRSDTMPTATG